MTLGSKRRLTVLFAIAVLLIATQGVMANTVSLGTFHGWLGLGHDTDVFVVGPASDWINSTAKMVVSADGGLDLIACFFFVLPTPSGGIPDELTCTDRNGLGGSETLAEFISRSDFPSFTWQANAILVIAVSRFSGSGNYSGELFVYF